MYNGALTACDRGVLVAFMVQETAPIGMIASFVDRLKFWDPRNFGMQLNVGGIFGSQILPRNLKSKNEGLRRNKCAVSNDIFMIHAYHSPSEMMYLGVDVQRCSMVSLEDFPVDWSIFQGWFATSLAASYHPSNSLSGRKVMQNHSKGKFPP